MNYIETENWKRKKQFEQFRDFGNPCYVIGLRLDVTNLVQTVKAHGLSFFSSFIYVLTQVCNEFEGFRLRFDEQGRVVCFDRVDPSYTVFMPDHGYDVCRSKLCREFKLFHDQVQEDIRRTRAGANGSRRINEGGALDVLYYSCMPWLDAQVYANPLPLGDRMSMSIPRINWGKYVPEGGRYKMFISFTANHALMDGYEISQAIQMLQDSLDHFDQIITD